MVSWLNDQKQDALCTRTISAISDSDLCWSSLHKRPAWGRTPARCSPPSCPVSLPAAEPCSGVRWARCGASPPSVSAGRVTPVERREGIFNDNNNNKKKDKFTFLDDAEIQFTHYRPHSPLILHWWSFYWWCCEPWVFPTQTSETASPCWKTEYQDGVSFNTVEQWSRMLARHVWAKH